MDMTFNKNIDRIQPSRSMVIMSKAKKMKAVDPQIIDLAGGEPDFDTPKKICDELFKQINDGYTHYTVGPGLPELRQRISEKLKIENKCDYGPDEIIVTPGGKYAVYMSVKALVNPGDEVLYLNPAWVSYPSIVEACGAIPVPVDLNYDDGYKITLEQLEEKYSEKTKMIIINYPNNPTGKMLSPNEAVALTKFMKDHQDLVLISDEMYECITYDGRSNISLAADPEISKRVITVNGFSKSVAMTGWRIGYMACDSEIAAIANKLFQHTISCVSGFIQKSAVVALDCKDEIEHMRLQYEKRRNFFTEGLNSIPGVECMVPEGAFYAWTSFDIPDKDTDQICDFILEKAKVVGVPGNSYGENNKKCIRFSFAASEEMLKAAISNIAIAMNEILQN